MKIHFKKLTVDTFKHHCHHLSTKYLRNWWHVFRLSFSLSVKRLSVRKAPTLQLIAFLVNSKWNSMSSLYYFFRNVIPNVKVCKLRLGLLMLNKILIPWFSLNATTRSQTFGLKRKEDLTIKPTILWFQASFEIAVIVVVVAVVVALR